MTDEETLKQLGAGGAEQTSALRRLYAGKGKEFGRFFVARGLDRTEAQDVLQDTILKIIHQASSYRGNGSANSWMWQIARNSLVDYMRRQQKEVYWSEEQWRLAEDDESKRPVGERVLQVTDEKDRSREAEKCVSSALAKFSDEEPDRAYALELVVEGFDGNEIADRIGRSNAATRQYLLQCRQRFAPYIKDCLQLLAA